MGEVADNNTLMKKKKKGRPSLLDLQKRALKQQQLLQRRKPDEEEEEELRSGFRNPNSVARSNRRNSNSDDDDDERRDKKHRLLHGLNSHDRRDSSNSKSIGGDLDSDAIRRRKIDGSDDTGEKASKATDILLQRGSLVESTPLPDKKLLLFILDRVQKKDTYGVYSDPADPEELPDYYEIIKNPMDFSTLRKKLESGAYTTLEQFEQDVFLICTNAMEYNSADTVYFRQARAMLELAKKDFGNLRQESDGEEPVSLSQQPKVAKRGRPPGSGLKKQLEQSLIDRTTSDISADTAAPTYAGDGSRLSGSYNLRKNPPSYGLRQAETSVRINHNTENQSGLMIDWEKEFPPSVVKAVHKYGMKNVDENRRDTYNQISTSLQESSIFTMLEDDLKQLTPVGLKTEYGYARSLARYAANLSPVAWRFANARIEKLLPTGTEFGPGWVGENPEAPPENPPQQQNLLMGKQKCSNDFASDDHHQSSRIMSPTTSVSSSIIGNRHFSHESKESVPTAHVLNQETESNGIVRASSGFNQPQNQMLETAVSQQGLFPNIKQGFQQLPPDLNARLVSPNSPGSNHQAGSSQHPDLALQL
ncbi:Bromodomain [Arabidopsis suecica]|uniref:Bromodomain n=1 Tax=Arabidopsis suecica TaxID=45249 RepID=A0A8T2BSB6_ARASU|nr:Bromodomain [Arabidopsis suecica]